MDLKKLIDFGLVGTWGVLIFKQKACAPSFQEVQLQVSL